MDSQMRQWIDRMLEDKASDLVLTQGQPPLLRVNGDLSPIQEKPLVSDEMQRLAFGLLGKEMQAVFEQTCEADASFGIENIARFRLNVFRQQGAVGLVIRMLPHKIPTLESLGVAEIVKDWLMVPHGIIVTTGPTGSGKSTTQAAMIGYLNQHKRYHIITIEDPVEYTHRHGTCTIEQREGGRDTRSFAGA